MFLNENIENAGVEFPIRVGGFDEEKQLHVELYLRGRGYGRVGPGEYRHLASLFNDVGLVGAELGRG